MEYDELCMVAGENMPNPMRYQNALPDIRTLSQATAFCETYWARHNPNSLPTFMAHLREFLHWAHDHVEHPCLLVKVDHHLLARYRFFVENREAKTKSGILSGSSVQAKMNAIAAMYKILVQLGFVRQSPIRLIETPRVKRKRMERTPFEELKLPVPALRDLLDATLEGHEYWDLRDRVLIHLFAYFGIRPVEASWIKMSALLQNRFRFNRAKRNYSGDFCIPDELCDWMSEMETQYGILPHQPLFLSQYRTGISVRGIEKIVHKYGEKIGISNLTPKDFRPTVQTFMERNFGELHRDKYVGYVETTTARKHYVKVPHSEAQDMLFTWVGVLKGSFVERSITA